MTRPASAGRLYQSSRRFSNSRITESCLGPLHGPGKMSAQSKKIIEIIDAIFDFIRKLLEFVFPMHHGMDGLATVFGAAGFLVGPGIHVAINLEEDATVKKKLTIRWLIISIVALPSTLSVYRVIFAHSGSSELSLFFYSLATLLCIFGFFVSFSFLSFCLFRLGSNAGSGSGKPRSPPPTKPEDFRHDDDEKETNRREISQED